MPRPKRQYDALELSYNRRFSENYFFSANYTLSRLYGNYAGLASSDEILTPTTGVQLATAQQQAGSISREGGNVNRAWDLDELMWDSKAPSTSLGRLATDRPHVVKLYGAYDFKFGTQLGAFFYGGERHADDDLRHHHEPDPGDGERPRRHGSHAVAQPHRPALSARAAAGAAPSGCGSS